MGFLDNSGDIILDAVLTDTGRFRLAKGDGTFRITKFAMADDEIDYAKYEINHSSGSAYYDLDILKTPVLEAFTNNTSLMKSKLLSINKPNLLFLPILGLNETDIYTSKRHALGTFVVTVDETTENSPTDTSAGVINPTNSTGIIKGREGRLGTVIRVDQGLDTLETSYEEDLDGDLVENQYTITLDNRLGKLMDLNGSELSPSVIDDDDFAIYNVSKGANATMVQDLGKGKDLVGHLAIRGPRGTSLSLRVKASLRLNTSTALFDELGNTAAATTIESTASGNIKYIDTFLKIEGATTGYKIDIPIRFVKKV